MRRQLYFEIFAVSLAAILLEVAYTRVFSFKVYYYFTYLIIGMALMGLGAGAVLVSVVRALREMAPPLLIARASVAGAAAVLPGYLFTATVELNASALSSQPSQAVTLALVCIGVALPFLAVGMVVSTVLSSRAENAGRLYAADLLGAGLGCAASIPLLEALDPPRVIVLGGAVLALGGLVAAGRQSRLRAVGVLIAIIHAGPLFSGSVLPDPIVDRLKGYEEFREQGMIRTTRWNPVFRVDVAEHPTETGELFLLFHDGAPGSGMRHLPKGQSGFAHLDTDSRSLPFAVLGERVHPRVLVIGAAGGHEIVASLHFGAAHVTGVELNTTTLDLLTGEYADITGRLHENPRVTLVNGDGRWFLAQSQEKFDLIWFVAPDSYAAMNASTSGAYVLAESYLYTAETLAQAMAHLSPKGLLCAQFGEVDYEGKPNRTIRFISTARAAFFSQHIPDFDERVLVSTAVGLPPFSESTVILSKSSLTDEHFKRFEEQVNKVPGGKVRFHEKWPKDTTPVSRSILIPQDLVGDWYREYRYLVDPVRDESPFFWHFAKFRDALLGKTSKGTHLDLEDSLGERVLFVLLGISTVLGVAFLFLPFLVMRRTFGALRHRQPAAVYFASLGLGFMFIEIPLIQKLTLLLGYPTRSLTVTLLSLLISTGLGSYLSTRVSLPWRRALGLAYASLIVLTSIWLFGIPRLVAACVGAPLPVRMFVAFLATAPMGVILGTFLPIGIAAITQGHEHPRLIVSWAWAVNSFTSVIASILAAILAMIVGFKFLIIAAPVIYAVGALALMRLGESPEAEGASDAGSAAPV